jgi:hypothetical protein
MIIVTWRGRDWRRDAWHGTEINGRARRSMEWIGMARNGQTESGITALCENFERL